MNRTKDAIIEAFWDLLDERPFHKITVKDIVDRCQINRNTFYYHFHDIPELLEITVKQEADDIIRSNSQFGSHLDCVKPFVELSLRRKRALLHIYRSLQREVLLKEAERIATYAVTEYIRTAAADLMISERDNVLLIRFYKCLLIGVMLDWLDDGMQYDLLAAASRLAELFGDPGRQAYLNAAESFRETDFE